MQRPWWLIVVLAGLLSVAFASRESEETERNRQLLAKWKKTEPEHYERLLRDLRAFYALPINRQEEIRDVDMQLHETDPETQSQLWGALERFSDWMEKLPEAERRLVMESSDRIGVIRALKQREWYERLPRAIREELQKLPSDKRIARILDLRLQQGQQSIASQSPQVAKDSVPRPDRFSNLPPDVQTFWKTNVERRLNSFESSLLKKAEGKWPDYPKQIAAYAERYPVLPEGSLGKVVWSKELPMAMQAKLTAPKKSFGGPTGGFGRHPGFGGIGVIAQPKWAMTQGKWPEFALAVSEAMQGDRNMPQLGASRPSEFSPTIREYIEKTLRPTISQAERDELARYEGNWPEYPKRLLAVARKHRLVIPGMSLPGPPEMWEMARSTRLELAPEERAAVEAISKGSSHDLREFLGKWPSKSKGHR